MVVDGSVVRFSRRPAHRGSVRPRGRRPRRAVPRRRVRRRGRAQRRLSRRASESLDAPVAVKCLDLPRRSTASLASSVVESFHEGCKLHYRLARGHLAIAQTFASGTTVAPRTGAQVPYIVREWFEGESLAPDLRRRRAEGENGRTLAETIALFEPDRVGARVRARARTPRTSSLMPSNLFLAKKDGRLAQAARFRRRARRRRGRVVAQRTDGDGAAALKLLLPTYAAPEQLLGTLGPTGPVDGRLRARARAARGARRSRRDGREGRERDCRARAEQDASTDAGGARRRAPAGGRGRLDARALARARAQARQREGALGGARRRDEARARAIVERSPFTCVAFGGRGACRRDAAATRRRAFRRPRELRARGAAHGESARRRRDAHRARGAREHAAASAARADASSARPDEGAPRARDRDHDARARVRPGATESAARVAPEETARADARRHRAARRVHAGPRGALAAKRSRGPGARAGALRRAPRAGARGPLAVAASTKPAPSKPPPALDLPSIIVGAARRRAGTPAAGRVVFPPTPAPALAPALAPLPLPHRRPTPTSNRAAASSLTSSRRRDARSVALRAHPPAAARSPPRRSGRRRRRRARLDPRPRRRARDPKQAPPRPRRRRSTSPASSASNAPPTATDTASAPPRAHRDLRARPRADDSRRHRPSKNASPSPPSPRHQRPLRLPPPHGVWGKGQAGVVFKNDGTVRYVIMSAPFKGPEGKCVAAHIKRRASIRSSASSARSTRTSSSRIEPARSRRVDAEFLRRLEVRARRGLAHERARVAAQSPAGRARLRAAPSP